MSRIDRYLPNDGAAPPPRAPVADTGETTGFSISLSDIRTMAWRQRWLIGSVVGAALLAGLIFTLLATPIYQATATVQLRQERSNIVQGQNVDPTDAIYDAGRYLKTQEQILASRAMAERVVRALHLADNDRFLVTMRADPIPDTVPAAQRAFARFQAVADVTQKNFSAKVPQDSRVAQISFTSPDPVLAARVAQAYAENYVQANVDTTFQSTSYARKFLDDQVAHARDRLAASEREAISYARKMQLIDASDAASSSADAKDRAGRSLVTASLVKLNDDYNTARAARIEAEGRWQVAQRTPLMQVPEVAQNVTIATLQGDRATAQAQLNQLRERYRGEHPEVLAAAARVNTLTAQIQRLAMDIRASLQNAARITASREAALTDAINNSRSDVLTEQQRRVELNVLSQDVETNRATLSDLFRRFNEVNAAAGITANNLSLVDSALVPERPIRPRPLYNLGLALVMGLVIGLALAIAREAVDDTVRSPDDVERKLQQPLLGATPKLKTSGKISLDTLTDASSMLSESYFSIRAALDFSTVNGRPHTLLVTSSASSEGKSTTAMALALDYARIGLRTLLVDADLRRPNVHRMMNLPNKIGFIDVLLEQLPLEKAIQRLPDSTLDILTLGKIVPNPVQILSSDAVPRMLKRYADRYDVIIFDTAPVMGIADTPLLSRSADGVLVIVEAGRAHRGQAKTTLKRLQETGGNVLGVVLTKFDSRDAGYGYSYYNYYYSYSGRKGQ